MKIYYEFYDNGYRYRIYSNGLWKKTKSKINVPIAFNNIKPIIDQLKAKILVLTNG